MRFKATIVTGQGVRHRVAFKACSGQRAQRVIDKTFPDQRYLSLIVVSRRRPC
jgi:hypothetical protein